MSATTNTNCVTVQFPKKSQVVNFSNIRFPPDVIDHNCATWYQSPGGGRHASECMCILAVPSAYQHRNGLQMILLFNRMQHTATCTCPKTDMKRQVLRKVFSDNRGVVISPGYFIWIMDYLLTIQDWSDHPVKVVWDSTIQESVACATSWLINMFIQIFNTSLLPKEHLIIIDEDPIIAADRIVEYSCFCPNIKRFITGVSIDFRHYGDCLHFRNWKELESLSIVRCNEGAPHNFSVFASFETIVELTLIESSAIDDEFLSLIKINCRLIEEFCVQDCPNLSAHAISDLLSSLMETLTVLNINVDNFSYSLSEAICSCLNLAHLTIGFNRFCDAWQFKDLKYLQSMEMLHVTKTGKITNEDPFSVLSNQYLISLTTLLLEFNTESFSRDLLKSVMEHTPNLEQLTFLSPSRHFKLEEYYFLPLSHRNAIEYVMQFGWKRILKHNTRDCKNKTFGVPTRKEVHERNWSIVVDHDQNHEVEKHMDWLHVTIEKRVLVVDIAEITVVIKNILNLL